MSGTIMIDVTSRASLKSATTVKITRLGKIPNHTIKNKMTITKTVGTTAVIAMKTRTVIPQKNGAILLTADERCSKPLLG